MTVQSPDTQTLLSLTALRVADLERSAEFYIRGCGFVHDKDLDTPTFRASIIRAGAAGLELVLPRGSDGEAPHAHGDMFIKIVLNTDDVTGRMAAACSHGGVEETPATKLEAYGMVIGTVRDPDGYLVEFVQRG
ncbi:VOC family protein [Rhodococcus sp. NPDC047139]|uniref:VOC family protein n=1 Tax=Rhodococcus sp. NPDC047139 TaxID=3155141 RepID=UPI0033ECC38B